VDPGAAAGAVPREDRGDSAVPGRGVRGRTAPAEGGGAVGPLHALSQGACGLEAGGGGVADQTEEASLSLHRVHLSKIAQHALRTTGVVCGL
jgi:hypothetical protein